MEPNTAVSHAPINFFARGAEFISDKFEMNIIDTANANAFENFEFISKSPDMMQNYVEADKASAPASEQKTSGGIIEAIGNFFASPAET